MAFERLDLNGKIALVTGASRGIGAAIAASLASRGALVIGTATSDQGAISIQEALRTPAQGNTRANEHEGVVLQVNEAAACEALVDRLVKQYGGLHVLVNNAGITRDNLTMRMKESEWDEVVATNLSAVFRMTRLVTRPMIKARTGRIINITSVVGHSGNAGQANYAAAKAGVEGMSRALAREIGSRGVTVNCVAPGFIDTDMTRGLAAEQTAALVGSIPLARLGAASDIAEAVSFLASDAASYLTGTTLHVNGGMYM
jgi:3-oxoacyl-[acyl-carrier protein] reductase